MQKSYSMKTHYLFTAVFLLIIPNIFSQGLHGYNIDNAGEPVQSNNKLCVKNRAINAGQIDSIPFYRQTEKHISKSINGDIWLRDSIYYYQGNNEDWILNSKYLVIARDKKNRTILAKNFLIDSNKNWVNSKLTIVSYYDNDILKDSLVLEWNPEEQSYNDTIFHRMNNPKGDIIELVIMRLVLNGFNGNSHKNYIKEKYSYNSNYKLVRYSKYNRREKQNWEKRETRVYTYENGHLINLIKHFFLFWDYDQINPEKMENYIYTYDDHGDNIIEVLQKKKTETDSWINYIKYINTYYTDSKLKTQIYQEWNIDNNKWENYFFSKIKYENDKVISQYWDKWENDTFKTYYRELFTYNTNRELIHKLIQYYNANDDTWGNSKEYIHKYNDFGRKILYVFLKRNKRTTKHKTEYDSENRFLNFTWLTGSENNTWINRWFTSALYSANQKQVTYLSNFWDKEKNQWAENTLDKYYYDDYDNLIEYTNRKKEKEEAIWENNYRKVFFWSKKLVNKVKEINNQITLYPNPCSSFIDISGFRSNQSLKKIQIFSIYGQLLKKSESRSNEIHLNLSNIRKGIYILKIISDNKMTKKRFLKI